MNGTPAPARINELISAIKQTAASLPVRPRIMEVCGTHTVAIFRHGLRSLLEGIVDFISGPGCPVCVTPDATVDLAVAHAREGHLVVTYGDMMRVPGTEASLLTARAEGADVRVVTSALTVADLAAANPDRPGVFLAVGFETTAPGTGLLLREAITRKLDNVFILAAHKLIPPAMRVLLSAKEQVISGFLCPGHVSAVIGLAPYQDISGEFGVPCVVAGFAPEDILLSILMILRQLREGRASAEIQYTRVVKPEGNPAARWLLEEFFTPVDSAWRGLGVMPHSGLALAEAYKRFDAELNLPLDVPTVKPRTGCRCGEVLRGVLEPSGCPHYGRGCLPETPLGPCMVSSEGTCGTHYIYGDQATTTLEKI